MEQKKEKREVSKGGILASRGKLQIESSWSGTESSEKKAWP